MIIKATSMRLAFLFAGLLSAPALLLAHPAAAQDGATMSAQADEQTALEARADQVVAVVNGEIAPEGVFTAGFLADIPPAQLAAIAADLTGNFGKAIAVESIAVPNSKESAFSVRMERAIAQGVLAIDPAQDDRVSFLRFTAFEAINDSAAKIEADLRALPGQASAYFAPLEGGEPVISIAPDTQLALGSTFKFYVLAALSQDIVAGQRSWDDVVALDARSFPSGQMQDWPEGSPVTLHTLASLMISISDNTATDQLIAVLGRERIEKVVKDSGHARPELNVPFMTTREMFLLKGGESDRLAAYSKATASARAQILDGIESAPVAMDQIEAAFSKGPVALDIEWFASARDLARLFTFMGTFADDTTYGVMSINENISGSAREGWAYVGYKGGSEPGVLNLTWLLTDTAGETHILSLGWNNPDANLDETRLELIAQRILALSRD